MGDKETYSFADYGQLVKKAVADDNYREAFRVTLDGIDAAKRSGDKDLARALLSLIGVLRTLMSIDCGVDIREGLPPDEKCILCGAGKEGELLRGTGGAICRTCAIVAYKCFVEEEDSNS